MSKIICDVCGTSYPETAEQCPICGCVRPVNVQGVISDGENTDNKSGYTYVKGGRFSKANVKKRNRAAQNSLVEPEPEQNVYQEEEKASGSNKGLIITALILLFAIVAVIVYITVRIMAPSDAKPAVTQPETTLAAPAVEVPCTNIVPVKKEIAIDELNGAFLLDCDVEPADTTDKLRFSSSDESIVTVDEKTGLITAVAPGEATIIIECGSQKVECKIICDFEMPTEDTTEDTEESTEESTDPTYTADDITFNTRYYGTDGTAEVTLRYNGEIWRCYNGNIPLEEITWKSDNESIVTVDNGVVTAVGSGDTIIHAIWGEFDIKCKVRCLGFSEDTGMSGSGGNIGEG